MTKFFDQKPVIGLSPMDGISDEPFRFITNKYGKPDISYTEFVHVMGLVRGGEKLWEDFYFADTERPILAQLFGIETEYFYHASKIVAELGFDGVDINMGCPARSVTEHGAGAALIRNPALAKQIVLATKQGVKDWYESGGELTGIKQSLKLRIKKHKELRQKRCEELGVAFKSFANGNEREIIPVSVKTRIGYDQIIVGDWINHLNEVEPNHIALHGRTLKQLYGGQADWEAIAVGVATANSPVLANGDIKSFDDIAKVLDITKASGALIGRATYGNPWFFSQISDFREGKELKPIEINVTERIKVMLEHTKLHVDLKGEEAFVQMRKHLGWYASGFPNAVELRIKLVRSNSLEEVEGILEAASSKP